MQWKNIRPKGPILELHFATLLLGMNAVFAKFIHWPAYILVFARSLIAFLGLLLFLRFTKQSLKLSSFREYVVLLLLGLVMAAHWLTFFYAVQITSVTLAVVANFTFPVMTVFLEALWDKNSLKVSSFLSAILVLFGVYLVVPSFDVNDAATFGVLISLMSAFLYALKNVLTRQYAAKHSSTVIMAYQMMVTVLVLIPFSGQIFNLEHRSVDWYSILYLGILGTAVGHTIFTTAIMKIKVSAASVITSLQLVYSIVAAAILLGEIPSFTTICGALLIMAVSMWESYKGSLEQEMLAD